MSKFRIGEGLELRGQEDTIAALNALGDDVAKKILEQSIKEARKPFVKAARRRAPVETGLLKLSIGSAIRKYKVAGNTISVAVMGPRRNVGGVKAARIRATDGNAKREPANYAHLVELGTRAHTIEPETKQSLAAPGGPYSVVDVRSSAPQPFMRHAWSATVRSMENTLAVELWRRIKASAERARRQSRERKITGAVRGTRRVTGKTRRAVRMVGLL